MTNTDRQCPPGPAMHRPRMAILLGILTVATAAIAGCGLFEDDEGVSARSDGVRVTVRNHTENRIYFAVFGRELATLIDWVPHLDDERSVAAGSSRSIPHADIMMQDGEREALFYWWKAEVRGGQRVPGTLSSFSINL